MSSSVSASLAPDATSPRIPQRFASITEFSAFWGLSRSSIYTAMGAGKLPYLRHDNGLDARKQRVVIWLPDGIRLFTQHNGAAFDDGGAK